MSISLFTSSLIYEHNRFGKANIKKKTGEKLFCIYKLFDLYANLILIRFPF